MSVYALTGWGELGGGMAIIAAENETEAKSLCIGLDPTWKTDYQKPSSVEILPVEYHGPARVLCHFEAGE